MNQCFTQAAVRRLENIYNQKINNLDALKKSLLQRAYAGELTEKVFTV